MTFDPTIAPEVAFLLLADPDRRAKDPLAALRAARDLRTLIDAAERDAVHQARQASPAIGGGILPGRSWSEIGDCLGVSKQAAQQRFG
jgi:hypothetical protein